MLFKKCLLSTLVFAAFSMSANAHTGQSLPFTRELPDAEDSTSSSSSSSSTPSSLPLYPSLTANLFDSSLMRRTLSQTPYVLLFEEAAYSVVPQPASTVLADSLLGALELAGHPLTLNILGEQQFHLEQDQHLQQLFGNAVIELAAQARALDNENEDLEEAFTLLAHNIPARHQDEEEQEYFQRLTSNPKVFDAFFALLRAFQKNDKPLPLFSRRYHAFLDFVAYALRVNMRLITANGENGVLLHATPHLEGHETITLLFTGGETGSFDLLAERSMEPEDTVAEVQWRADDLARPSTIAKINRVIELPGVCKVKLESTNTPALYRSSLVTLNAYLLLPQRLVPKNPSQDFHLNELSQDSAQEEPSEVSWYMGVYGIYGTPESFANGLPAEAEERIWIDIATCLESFMTRKEAFDMKKIKRVICLPPPDIRNFSDFLNFIKYLARYYDDTDITSLVTSKIRGSINILLQKLNRESEDDLNRLDLLKLQDILKDLSEITHSSVAYLAIPQDAEYTIDQNHRAQYQANCMTNLYRLINSLERSRPKTLRSQPQAARLAMPLTTAHSTHAQKHLEELAQHTRGALTRYLKYAHLHSDGTAHEINLYNFSSYINPSILEEIRNTSWGQCPSMKYANLPHMLSTILMNYQNTFAEQYITILRALEELETQPLTLFHLMELKGIITKALTEMEKFLERDRKCINLLQNYKLPEVVAVGPEYLDLYLRSIVFYNFYVDVTDRAYPNLGDFLAKDARLPPQFSWSVPVLKMALNKIDTTIKQVEKDNKAKESKIARKKHLLESAEATSSVPSTLTSIPSPPQALQQNIPESDPAETFTSFAASFDRLLRSIEREERTKNKPIASATTSSAASSAVALSPEPEVERMPLNRNNILTLQSFFRKSKNEGVTLQNAQNIFTKLGLDIKAMDGSIYGIFHGNDKIGGFEIGHGGGDRDGMIKNMNHNNIREVIARLASVNPSFAKALAHIKINWQEYLPEAEK